MPSDAASLAPRRSRWRPHRRTVLKWLHWSLLPLFLWFLFITPEIVLRAGGQTAFRIHSALALVFVTLALLWSADYLRRGLAGRPGPKLPPWARRVHRWMHRLLVWGLFGVALSGFAIGLTSPVLLKAGGFLPFAPPLGLARAHEIALQVHVWEYYLLAVLAAGHAAFHLWRHLKLRDNALRIMAPRALHRFL
jgi:cytochrome b561